MIYPLHLDVACGLAAPMQCEEPDACDNELDPLHETKVGFYYVVGQYDDDLAAEEGEYYAYC